MRHWVHGLNDDAWMEPFRLILLVKLIGGMWVNISDTCHLMRHAQTLVCYAVCVYTFFRCQWCLQASSIFSCFQHIDKLPSWACCFTCTTDRDADFIFNIRCRSDTTVCFSYILYTEMMMMMQLNPMLGLKAGLVTWTNSILSFYMCARRK